MFKHLLFAVVLAFVFVFDQIWLIINDFFVGKITIKKPVAGKCVFMNTCNGIFFQHCIEHLYFWYHNMLLQLQHTCHKLLHYFIAGNYITNWFIISCDNYNECFHLLDSFEKWSVMHLCISGMNLASLKIFLLKFGTGTVQTVVFFVFVLFCSSLQ
jgi:hypothetical protein